ncbi:hypothetical protein [Endozoicomonas sp. ALE010]|uniref:hypothetical protein n=1 Tax=Endozoicomonas sp. ALE010 TaxID=3403081 RepID=UPI003BB7A67A
MAGIQSLAIPFDRQLQLQKTEQKWVSIVTNLNRVEFTLSEIGDASDLSFTVTDRADFQRDQILLRGPFLTLNQRHWCLA